MQQLTAVFIVLLLSGVTLSAQVGVDRVASSSDPEMPSIAHAERIRSHFGWAVANAGDVNGDGKEDVLVTAPCYEPKGRSEYRGRVYLFHGDLGGGGDPDWIAEGRQPDDELGASASGVGDVDGDGYDDVVIGVPGFDGSASGDGALFLYLGSPSGLPASPSAILMSGIPDAHYLGASVAGAGDVNRDGFPDVVGGAYPWGGDGAALLFEGGATGLSSSPSWSFMGNSHQGIGAAVAGVGDTNGDGFADIVISEGRRDDIDRSLLFLGSASGPAASPDWISQSDPFWSHVSISPAGDVNADGYDDFISARYHVSSSVRLYLGSSTGLETTAVWFEVSHDVVAGSVASLGDLNGDGFDDVAVSRYELGYGPTNPDRAEVDLYRGSPAGIETTPYQTITQHFRGSGLSALFTIAPADFNGDGVQDLVLGNPWFEERQPGRYFGAAFFHQGPDWSTFGPQQR